MKRLFLILLVAVPFMANASFNDYFIDKTLRIDYYHTGDANNDFYSLDEIFKEDYWGGSKTKLIDVFDYGKYKMMVYDVAGGKLIYSRTYATLFSEWQTTDEAKITSRTFSETVVCPFPKNKVRIEFHTRNRKGIFEKKFEYVLNPADYFISTEKRMKYPVFEVQKSGDPAVCVDIVFLPEGYTAAEMDKFRKDCKKYAGYLFNASPFKENRKKFNIMAVEAPSQESGTDIPGKNIWKNTILNSNFYTFGTERYLMTSDNKSVRHLAANVPYDQIYIIVNTSVYGGGAIFNHYAVSVSDNMYGEYVFVHEFGHSFAGLGDEYYDSETSYNEFYPLDVEPPDPNLTTLVNFDVKWKDMIGKGTPVPTPNDPKYKSTVGVFEGGGYVNKGVYRPYYDCTMKSISVDNFCPVCKDAIIRMIKFYTE